MNTLAIILALYAVIGAAITVLTVFSKSHKTQNTSSSDSPRKLSRINIVYSLGSVRFPLTD